MEFQIPPTNRSPALRNGCRALENGLPALRNGCRALGNQCRALENGSPALKNGCRALRNRSPAQIIHFCQALIHILIIFIQIFGIYIIYLYISAKILN